MLRMSRTTPSAAEPGRAGAGAGESDGERALVDRLSGRVTHRGKPVEGATLHLLKGLRLADLVEGSDRQGRFEFKRRYRGDFTLRAIHPEYAPTRMRVTIAEGDDSELVIELAASEWVEVRALDAATGAPIAGALVTVLRAGQGSALAGHNQAFEDVMAGLEPEEQRGAPDLSVFAIVDHSDLMLLNQPPAIRSAGGS